MTHMRMLRSTPEELGIASEAIIKFVERVEREIHELHSFMLVRHGKVAAEGWWVPYSAQMPHMLFSLFLILNNQNICHTKFLAFRLKKTVQLMVQPKNYKLLIYLSPLHAKVHLMKKYLHLYANLQIQ